MELAECKTLAPTWNKVTTKPSLPVKHGTEITLSCLADHTNKGGDKATCQNGVIVPTNGNNLPDCREIDRNEIGRGI